MLAAQVSITDSWAFDPLSTMPDVVGRERLLPGDPGTLACPVWKDFSTPLALDEAVDLSLCNSPQIREAWAKIKIQAGAVGEARAAYLPTLTGAVSHLSDKTSYPGSGYPASTVNSWTGYATLTWRLLDFGGRGAGRQAANNLLAAALLTRNYTIQKTLSDLIQAYFDAMTAKAALKAKTRNEEIARSTLEVAGRRETKGAEARSDTLQAATALAKASLEKNRAAGAYYRAVSVLVYSLGVPTRTSLRAPRRSCRDDRRRSSWTSTRCCWTSSRTILPSGQAGSNWKRRGIR